MAMAKVNGIKLLKCLVSNKSHSLRPIFMPSLNFSSNAKESFKFKDIEIQMATVAQKMRRPDPSTLIFGDTFTDHMFEVNWSEDSGWGTPKIVPLHGFHMHPGTKILHYATSVFEGMKAFRSSGGTIALFRPERNIERLVKSAKRAALPYFDAEEFLNCLKKLVSIERDWVPNRFGTSLYLRPTFIGGTEVSLGVAPPKKALLYVIASPMKSFFPSGVENGISLLADPEYVRSWPGHVGDTKMASNYAPTFYVQDIADNFGLEKVLWLRGDDNKITQGTVMNVFLFFQKAKNRFELATPKLDGTVVPGVVRQSLLQLAYNLQEFDVSERDITMDEIIHSNKNKSLLEMFVCGTATVVCPVNSVKFLDRDIQIPTRKSEKNVYRRLYKDLTDIQYRRVKSDWSVKVC